MEIRINQWNKFDKTRHLKTRIPLYEFSKLSSWDLGWSLLEQINIAENDQHEIELSECFSPGQKALYFFWYLDAQVTNGGFVQFYCNGYDKYLPAIIRGLSLVNDILLIKLITEVDKYYFENQTEFIGGQSKNNFEGIYSKLSKFDDFDNEYFEIRENSMKIIEKHARVIPAEFIVI